MRRDKESIFSNKDKDGDKDKVKVTKKRGQKDDIKAMGRDSVGFTKDTVAKFETVADNNSYDSDPRIPGDNNSSCDCDNGYTCKDHDVKCHCDDEYDSGCDTACGYKRSNACGTDCECDYGDTNYHCGDTKDEDVAKTTGKYNCRICGKHYNSLEEVMACEQTCLLKLREDQAKKAFEEKNADLLKEIEALKLEKEAIANDIKDLNAMITDFRTELDTLANERQHKRVEYNKVVAKLKEKEKELSLKEVQEGVSKKVSASKSFRKSIINGRVVYEVDGKEVDQKTYEEEIRNYKVKSSGPYWWEF